MGKQRGSAKKRRFLRLIEETYFKVFTKEEGEGEIHYADLRKYINTEINNAISNIDISGSGVFDPDLPDELEASFFVGGIPILTTVGELRGKTFEELWTMALFTAQPPNYVAPTANLSLNTSSLVEVGSIFGGTFTSVFNQNDAGNILDYELRKDNVFLTNNNPFTENTTENSPVVIPYRGLFSFDDGPILNDSNGNPDSNGQIMAGSVFTNIINVQWIYPYFWGVSSSNTGINYVEGNKVVQPSNGGVVINFNAVEEYLWFAVPAIVPNFTSWFVTALNQGNIGTPSDLFDAPSIEELTTLLWEDVEYKIYISNYVTTVNENMTIS